MAGWSPPGVERFDVLAKLGAGGMGVVYRAFDHERNTHVALKTLLTRDARALYRFKREFRAVADLVHPNLVTLYDFHTIGDECFFSMELIDGCSFISFVRRRADLPDPAITPGTASAVDPDTPTAVTGVLTHRAAASTPSVRGELDVDRLRSALQQLVDGVHALHCAGKLHRDIKPSNVLVTGDGRVVLLDFGLTSDKGDLAGADVGEGALGTPMYASPEQAARRPQSEASDWYSVGVVLYEALTGRRPFEHAGRDVVRLKQTQDPPPVRKHSPDAPDDLSDLAMALLSRDPAQRPGGAEILAALATEPSAATEHIREATMAHAFVGRESELAALHAALDASQRGECVSAFVSGPSGLGKSALIHRFLSELDPGAVVLSGRCYERESLPYKSIDTVIDALTRHLLQLPDTAIRELLPRDIDALSRLFPVLRRVPIIAAPGTRRVQPPDLQELRRRAFVALRQLLRNLGDTVPLALFIDDLQWGDVDSAGFLADLIQHPDPPSLLLVAAYRSDEETSSGLLRVLARFRANAAPGRTRDIRLGPLSEEAASDLVHACAGPAVDDARLREVIRESGGHALFLSELARNISLAGDSPTQLPSLDTLLTSRVAQLSQAARDLLRTSCVAGRPLRVDLSVRAAHLDHIGAELVTLRAERLVRVRRGDDEQLIEPYHDRVRESVVAGLSDEELRATHANLALALESEREPDHEALVDHWLRAGEGPRAAEHALRAATIAENTLAFHRAADLYAVVLEHVDHDEKTRRALLTARAHALRDAGRLDEAAAEYGAAAAGADRHEHLELSRLQLEQVLRRGHLEAGMSKAAEVLRAVNLELPRSSRGALLTIVRRMIYLKLRGLGFTPRNADEVDSETLLRIDVCSSVSTPLAWVAPFFGRALQFAFLIDALRAGERSRAAHALTFEIGFLSMAGVKKRKASEKLAAQVRELAESTGDPYALGVCLSTSGVASFLTGYWREAEERLREGEAILRDRTANARWEIDLTQIMRMSSLVYLGEFGELMRMVPIYLREAEERGDVYAARGFKGWRTNVTWLGLDQPEEARAHVEEVSTSMDGAFHLHHYYELLARVQIDLYSQSSKRAWERISEFWPLLKRSMLLRIQSVRIEGNYLRARAALAYARETGDSLALDAAEQSARAIDKERAPWGDPLVTLVRATASYQRGDTDRAATLLRTTADGLDRAEMAIYAAACRARLGALIGGDEGDQLLGDTREAMDAQGIRNGARMVDLYAPGW